MRQVSRVGLGLLLGLLAACASSDAMLQEERAAAVKDSWQEGCEDPGTLEFLCGEDVCAFYRCEELLPGRGVLTRGAAVALQPALPAPGSGAMRHWGSAQGLPRHAQPVCVIPWYNDKPQPVLPDGCEQQRKEAEELARKPRARHHIFPQEFKDWFTLKGINVHEWTLVLFQDDHDRIHRGARGGPWNAAWRKFTIDNPDAQKEAIWRHAGELIHQFELYGPVIPYYRRKLPDLCIPQPVSAR